MKLDSPSRFTSFYESFSDLIFATMAIFVLLFILLMTQVRPEVISESELEKLKKELEEQSNQIEELQDAIETKALELVIAIDVSGSMQPSIDILKTVLIELATELPNITNEFKLGIVAYRDSIIEFPIQQIQSDKVDGGASIASLNRFLTNLNAKSGYADIKGGLLKAIDYLRQHGSENGRKTIALIGDMGPYEYGDNHGVIDRNEMQIENEIYESIRNYEGMYEKASFLSIYTGKLALNQNSGVQAHPLAPQIMNFFKKSAEMSGENGRYTDSPREMLLEIVLSLMATDK